jgi:broad specificity phosphatase PhoE
MMRKQPIGGLGLHFAVAVAIVVVVVVTVDLSSCSKTARPSTVRMSWNDTEQLSFFMTESANRDALAYAFSQAIRSAWKFVAVPGVFAQQNGVEPAANQTQLANFGALKAWPDILNMLHNQPQRKLLILIRHGQAWENLNPDNTQCTFEYGGQWHNNVDSPLNPTGQQQASALNRLLLSPANATATWFETIGLLNAPFVVSPLARTMQTATLVLQKLPIQQPVQVNEIIRATIGIDVCNYRHPVSAASGSAVLPSPWSTNCNVTFPSNSSLSSMFNTSHTGSVEFALHVRPAGGSGFGLISDGDTLWRNDMSESAQQQQARAVAFLAQLYGVLPNNAQVLGVVTHGEIIDALSVAVSGMGYSAANTEVVPMMIDLLNSNM